jgi:hypothetical protein
MDFDEATKEAIDGDGSRWRFLNMNPDGSITDDAGQWYGRLDWVDEGRHAEGEPKLTVDPAYEGRIELAGNRKTGKIFAMLRSLQA